LPDGSKQVFGVSDGASAFPRKIFLTQVVDPAGNAVSYTFDSNMRMVAVTDALGQVTTLSYASTNSTNALFYKITQVTDPFGRHASFAYSSSGQLTNITDIIGINSSFTYTNDFIIALNTPYGTTTFARGESGRSRWLEATDPLGQKERMEYVDLGAPIPDGESAAPAGLGLYNGFLSARNSFYWDKKAMQLYLGDYSRARIYHWLHTANYQQASGIAESHKSPLEGRVWYTYAGQAATYAEGTNGLPSSVARVLDDGSSQVYKLEYNPIGKVTKVTDPIGRVTTNAFSTNLIDLLEVRQVVGATNQLLGSFTYATNHLPLTAIDAAGQTNFFGYNSYGQLSATTNALSQTVTMLYDTNGYLTNITGSVSGATTSFTYDGYGRVRTVTDSEGFIATTDYDAADRPTKITYPDNTYQQIVYDQLDPVLSRDRRGHWSLSVYDALRRVTDVQDALGRLTHLEWCGCGSLESITDPMGRVTTWLRDLQGRVQTKVYPDTTKINYTYETTNSRLKSVTDAKQQTTSYQYFTDNNLKQVSYSNAAVSTPSVSFSYHTNYNRLLTMTDGVGTTTYSYYAVTNGQLGAGKLQSLEGPWSNDTITYAYDELGRVNSRAINGVAQTASFDALGRVTVLTNALGSFTNEYVGVTGRIATNYYPNGQKTVFSYYGATNDFRLQQIQNLSPSAQSLSTFSYTYDADGQIATWTQQADASTPTVWVTEYDPVDQLLGVTVRSNSVTGTILKQFIYGYDKAGNRTSEQIQSGAGILPAISSATHNNANQLTSTTGGGALRFNGSMDELGTVTVAGAAATVDNGTTNFVGYAQVSSGTNVVLVVATDYSNNSRTNQYQIIVSNNAVARALSYDLNGNLTSVVTASSTNTYEWDAANRLTAVESRTGVSPVTRSEFAYDALGRRTQIVEKQNGSVVSTKKFLWCGTGLSEERDSTGGTVTKRFFGEGEQISGTNYFFTTDHLGSIREMTDGLGSIRARYEYDPFGRRTKVSGDLDADFAFTGHYFHSASGLYLTLYRAYDSDTGRWISRDPLEEGGGINLYAYVANNPLNAVDPLGLYSSLLGLGEIGLLDVAFMFGGTTWTGLSFLWDFGHAETTCDVQQAFFNLGLGIAVGWGLGRILGYLGPVAGKYLGKMAAKFSGKAAGGGTKLFGHTEYVIADADLAMSVQSSLLNDYAKNAPDPGIDIVDDLFENAFIDTVTGRIKLSGDLVENYPHLIDGAVTEELFHFLQLQAKNLIGKKLTPAQSVKMEAEVVLLMLNSGFKKL
jgi:RHS repeat-associated protein